MRKGVLALLFVLSTLNAKNAMADCIDCENSSFYLFPIAFGAADVLTTGMTLAANGKEYEGESFWNTYLYGICGSVVGLILADKLEKNGNSFLDKIILGSAGLILGNKFGYDAVDMSADLGFSFYVGVSDRSGTVGVNYRF